MGLAEKLGILIVEFLEETVLSLLSSLRFFIAVPNSDLVSHVSIGAVSLVAEKCRVLTSKRV